MPTCAPAAAAGYVGTVTEVSPICYSDPGMTNANMQFAVVEVDADAPENATVNPELEVRLPYASNLILIFITLTTRLRRPYIMGKQRKAVLPTRRAVHYRFIAVSAQEGEFIDVFLLPYDGLYAALLVRRPSECSM